jgi:hypothetical protein
MPHLKYNGRFWRVSSDELFLPGIFAILGRLFWSTVLIVILAYSTARLSRCSESKGLLAYLYISLIVSVLSFLCEVCLVRKSLLGSMVEKEKRDNGLEKFLTAHIVLCVSQFALAIFGVFVVSSDSYIPCASTFQMSKTYDLILLSVIIITQFVDISSLVCCCYTFSAKKGSAQFPEQDDVIATIWENRCKSILKCAQIFSCNIFGGGNVERDLLAVAKILTSFFHHDGFLDVVPSDILAGIILVRMQQRAKRFQLSSGELLSAQPFSSEIDIEKGAYATTAISSNDAILTTPDVIPDSGNETMEDYDDQNQSSRQLTRLSVHAVAYRRDLDKNSKSDRDTLELVAKYSVHMLAMYTHLMVLFVQPCTGLYCLCRSRVQISCGRCRRKQYCKCCAYSCCGRDDLSKHTPQVKGDNMFGTNHAGLSHFTRNVQSEVLYVSYENDTVRKPFGVFLNEEDRTVVIAIRGSLSIEDCITDAVADPIELLEAGLRWGFDGKNRFVHTGFLTAALSIREELEDTGILDHVFCQSKATDPKDREPTLRSESGVFVGSRDCEPASEVSAAEAEEEMQSFQRLALHVVFQICFLIGTFLFLLHSPKRDQQKCYRLVVVGHSLGAAAAAVLALLLRNQYPQVKCIGYGMPGSVYDWRTAQGEMRVDKMKYDAMSAFLHLFVVSRCIRQIALYTHILSTNLMVLCVLYG